MFLILVHLGTFVFFVTDLSPGTAAARTGLPLDDAWIHLVYGRGLLTSGLPCYNDGQPEAGFTSPVWVLVCAAAHGLALLPTLDIVLALKLLGLLCAIAMTLAVCELTRACTASGLGALLAGLLSALTPALAFSQIAGMEVCLAAAFSLWAVYVLQRKMYLATGVLLAAAFWTRPELLILYGLVILVVLLAWRTRVFGENRRALLKLAVPLIVAGALWSGYCLAVTGRFLPNTFYAKFQTRDPEHVLVIMREMLWPLPANFLLAGSVLYLLGVIQLVRQSGASGWIVLIFPWCFFFAIGASRSVPPGTGTYYYWVRYVVPAIPFLFVPIGAGWRFLWGRFQSAALPGAATDTAKSYGGGLSTTRSTSARRSRRKRPSARRALPGAPSPSPVAPSSTARPRARSTSVLVAQVAAVILGVLSLAAHPQELAEQRRQYAWNCQNINELQVALGRWVAANTPPDAAVVVNDAGAIRYFGGRRTIDLMGLNFHPLVRNRSKLREIYSSPLGMRAFMREHGAEYLIVFPSWFPGVFRRPEAKETFASLFAAKSDRYTVAPVRQDIMVVYAPR